jgi:hypothetical protein
VWRVTVRLAGKLAGAGAALEVVLEGLGATRVEEVLRQAAAALGVGAEAGSGAEMTVWCEGRGLRGEETLTEAGVGVGGVVEVFLGSAGGMPGAGAASMSALAGPAEAAACGSDEELARLVGQLARDALEIEGAVTRLLEVVRLPQEGANQDSAWAGRAGAAAVNGSREPKVPVRSASDTIAPALRNKNKDYARVHIVIYLCVFFFLDVGNGHVLIYCFVRGKRRPADATELERALRDLDGKVALGVGE